MAMYDSDSLTQSMLSNPSKLTKFVIDEMEAMDTTGQTSIPDPNNGFVMQLAATCAIAAKFSEKIDAVISGFYPQRARNAEQLYAHLSEYDYVKLMASPATLPFVFGMSREWIIDNAVYYDTNYSKIQIPATSYITMGGMVYSMYHPIDILVNRNTKAISAVYNTETSNPLNVLASNMLLDVQEVTRNAIAYFQISFNMYLFTRTVESYTVSTEEGFIKTLNYDDQFYAVKVLNQSSDGSWTELAYSLTKRYYDYTTPTALLSILTDTSQLKIEIPQIYFDNGQIAKTIRVELYTTKGAVNYTLSLADTNGLKANFSTESSVYAKPLDKMPSWYLLPTTTDVVGGSDAFTYAEMRNAVVNNGLYDRLAITPPEVLQAAKKAGFDDLRRVVDDLTERVYFASNNLTDSNGFVVPTFTGNIVIADDALDGNPSSILKHTDGYYTILPTTVFTIANNGSTCTPLSDGDVQAFGQLTKAAMVDALNTGHYVRQPFHITLLTNSKSPQASLYNLMSPVMTSLSFNAENAYSAPQLAVTTAVVTHLGNGTGGYQILFGVGRSNNLRGTDASLLRVYLTCKTKIGTFAYLPASYVGSDTANNIDTWKIVLPTSYHITTDNYLTVQMLDTSDHLVPVDINLTQSFTLITSFVTTMDASIPQDPVLSSLLPPTVQGTQTAMAQQTMVIELGQNLSDKIYCGVTTNWGQDVYKTADTVVYHTTDVPIFQTNEQNVLHSRVASNGSGLEVVVLYPQDATPATKLDLGAVTTATVGVPTSGTTTLVAVTDTTGVLVGMPVRGLTIPVGTVVAAKTATSVTLSTVITAALPAGSTLTFTNPSLLLRTSAAQTSASRQLSVASTANLLIGQSVCGFDIPTGTTIQAIPSATTLTLSATPTAALPNNTLLTIVNKTAPGVVKVMAGGVLTDTGGKPIVIRAAQNQYLIPAILFDGRLFASQDPSDQNVITSIASLIQSYAHQAANFDAGVSESSEVYYRPSRTMGLAQFGIGNDTSVELSLELSLAITIYVDEAVYANQPLRDTMSTSIMAITSTAFRQPLISTAAIAQTITEQLGGNVVAVKIGDISNQDGLRLIALETGNTTPSIENKLVLKSDDTIGREPNITISYVIRPDSGNALGS